jgi:hypothetical protein
MKKPNTTIELYNSEGPCLVAVRLGENLYQIVDQWRHPIRNVSAVDLLCVYHGIETVIDSSGKTWNLGKEMPGGPKPTLDDIMEYIRENEKNS